ncbi:MAG: type II CRISPR RNA-guided endonuclease Cas9 [candidate division Zixibacteria bacterium CG_4_9_14_3_um_filter_46_8]|nr:MAG: type II CRISPR RNA-guided endonuclease Cas9 [candidate division Zixibacteria bacterium CG_4_9_14_3_um_filter_46_8]
MDGTGKSRNVERREARGVRRLIERRARRLQHLSGLLQRHGFLPGDCDVKDPLQRHLLFETLDSQLASPYVLRAKALDERLEPYELGRAIYHLAQRRGFWSNRKSPVTDEKEEKGMKKEISDLDRKIKESDARTLGEYFSNLDPAVEPIRGLHTSRKMYAEEFEQIWSSQSRFHPQLTDPAFKKAVYDFIFKQRPLKSHLIGECELEKGRRRAPWALLSAQRFRYLQKVNDLQIIIYETGECRELTEDERKLLIENFENRGDLEFKTMKGKKFLNLPKTAKFNLEEGGEKRIPGNKTSARLIKIFGNERWNGFTEDERNQIVEDYLSIVKNETLKNRGRTKWGLDEKTAEKFGETSLEAGYCRYSRQALAKLLPLLQKGVQLQIAEKAIRQNYWEELLALLESGKPIHDAIELLEKHYPERLERLEKPWDLLPAVPDYMRELKQNPIVHRALTELRRVVNAIIKRYGKPDIVRVELGRDLRKSADQRQEAIAIINANRVKRDEAKTQIAEYNGDENPSERDILKVLLREECGGYCPYTGKPISMGQLLGEFTQFHIEHIIPFDRCLDDSFANKTLCYHEENQKKHNRTPYEAYHGTEKWEEIIERVRKFNVVKFKVAKSEGKKPYAVKIEKGVTNDKLGRFQMEPEEVEKLIGDFTTRQLNDTRWAAKMAKQYLGLLYGGVKSDGIDASGKRRVQVGNGQVTGFLRREWGLNKILGDGDFKSRDDHRHHAIDAIVTALTDAGKIKALSDASKRGQLYGRKFMEFPPPWEGFHRDVQNIIDKIVVSHRVSRRARGALHREKFYSPPKEDKNGKYVTIRTPLKDLTEPKVEKITPDYVRELIEKGLCGKSPQDAFKDDKDHPSITGKNGKAIPIHSVTVKRYTQEVFGVGESEQRRRYVFSKDIHHMEIFKDDKTGKGDAEVVSMFEAYQRKGNKEPIIKKDFGAGKTFLFSLAKGEIIKLDNADKGWEGLYVVRKLERPHKIQFAPINDARKLEDIGRKGHTATVETLKKPKCQKVVVTPLGEIRDAND